MNRPPIVIAAYNRPDSFQRLLGSVLSARYPADGVTLIISIDKSETEEVYAIADNCEWKYGEKIVLKHSQHLGLKQHILSCGDFALQYGSAIILEDDLLVSPYYYQYACSAKQFYELDANVAGISLYNYQIAENEFVPFYPIEDGSDVYFIQVASSWGQLFFDKSWLQFRSWLKENDNKQLPAQMPGYLIKWSAFSWKKYLNWFLIEQDRYFVFPRVSLSTNFGEPGTNADRRGLYQVPLLDGPRDFRFINQQSSTAIYDSWFEITPSTIKRLYPALQEYDLTVDLYSTKLLSQIQTPYLLSAKHCSAPIMSFANDVHGAAQNIIKNITGNFYCLGVTSSFTDDAIDIGAFYISSQPIYDIVFDSQIKKMHNQFNAQVHELNQQFNVRVDELYHQFDIRTSELRQELNLQAEQRVKDAIEEHKFNNKFPQMHLLVYHNASADFLQNTLQSVWQGNYPENRIKISVFYSGETPIVAGTEAENVEYLFCQNEAVFFEKLITTINQSPAQYYSVLYSGEVFFKNALNAANEIFTRFRDVHWITGIETALAQPGFITLQNSTPNRRWNERIFTLNMKKKAPGFIPPSATFWRRYGWDTAQNQVKFAVKDNLFNNLWAAFFKMQPLYVCDVYMSASPYYSEQKSKQDKYLEEQPLKKLAEFFFVRNIPYLRSYYKNKNRLCQVIRFDYTVQDYFMSDY